MGWLEKLAAVCIAKPLRALGLTRAMATTARIALGCAAALMLATGPERFSLAAALFVAGFCWLAPMRHSRQALRAVIPQAIITRFTATLSAMHWPLSDWVLACITVTLPRRRADH
jgi:hypothetical protein